MTERYEVLVVGAGPGGLAAAGAAAQHGARVGLIDLQPLAGGQVWRHDVGHADPALAQRYIAAIGSGKVDWLARSTVVAAEPGRLLVEDPERARWIAWDQLILATGARELLLPFPGWTLPGVTGAGGLQALAKQGWPLAGKRVVVSGSGPLLLAVAATARRHGARVVGIYEQASRAAVMRFARGLWRWPKKALQAAQLRAALAGVPYRWGSVVAAAYGRERLEEIEIAGSTAHRRVACDFLATGYGLVPNVRLARLLGCKLDESAAQPCVAVDAEQCTSVGNVYAVGEACGIGGRDAALVEGAIAGHAAVGARVPVSALQRRKRHARAFSEQLRRCFALDPRVKALAQPDTVICRCEDVRWHDLAGHAGARSAKLATRCGMGPCQGRICGAALAEMGRFTFAGERELLFPARLATLACADDASTAD